MSQYRRAVVPGGCFFFTLVTDHRYPWFADPRHVSRLREGFRRVRNRYPFELDAIVVLPDHLHLLMSLPEGDSNYALRLRLIKHYLTRGMTIRGNHRGEKPVWQKRYWEHAIRDDNDWRRHLDYVHFNPVKHGYVTHPSEWPYSSFHRCVEKGWYAIDWGRTDMPDLKEMEFE